MNTSRVPSINLLGHEEPTPPSAPEPVAARPPTPAVSRHYTRGLLIGAAGVMLVAGGVGGYLFFSPRKEAPMVEVSKPVEKPVAVTPTPTPAPTPAPETVTAPAATPTAEHPQTVTVKAPHGLWLRSAPDPSTKANIVAWMPDGAQVSVDRVGETWWHGTYKNKTGYFNVKYTQ